MPKVAPECFNFTSWRIRLPHLKQFRKEDIDGTIQKVQSLKEKEERKIDTKIIKCQYINNFGSLDNVDDF